jgi:hypothetical protein
MLALPPMLCVTGERDRLFNETWQKNTGNKSEMKKVTENGYIIQYPMHEGGSKSYWKSGHNL